VNFNRLQLARTLLDNGAGKIGKVPARNAQAAGIQEGSADSRQGQSVSRRHFQKFMATPAYNKTRMGPRFSRRIRSFNWVKMGSLVFHVVSETVALARFETD
jgi:hypothetical protein